MRWNRVVMGDESQGCGGPGEAAAVSPFILSSVNGCLSPSPPSRSPLSSRDVCFFVFEFCAENFLHLFPLIDLFFFPAISHARISFCVGLHQRDVGSLSSLCHCGLTDTHSAQGKVAHNRLTAGLGTQTGSLKD